MASSVLLFRHPTATDNADTTRIAPLAGSHTPPTLAASACLNHTHTHTHTLMNICPLFTETENHSEGSNRRHLGLVQILERHDLVRQARPGRGDLVKMLGFNDKQICPAMCSDVITGSLRRLSLCASTQALYVCNLLSSSNPSY